MQSRSWEKYFNNYRKIFTRSNHAPVFGDGDGLLPVSGAGAGAGADLGEGEGSGGQPAQGGDTLARQQPRHGSLLEI